MSKVSRSVVALVLGVWAVVAVADMPTYHNIFISYASPDNVKKLDEYISNNKLAGGMLWEVAGDLPSTDSNSLMGAFAKDASTASKVFSLYWANWDLYQASQQIPGDPKYIKDFQSDIDTLYQLNHEVRVNYAFLEAVADTYHGYDSSSGQNVDVCNSAACLSQHPDYIDNVDAMHDKIGTVYFNDPWSDLGKASCDNDALSDTYVMQEKNRAVPATEQTCSTASSADNAGDFSHLQNTKKIISIGGYGHDDSFEVLFSTGGEIEAINSIVSPLTS